MIDRPGSSSSTARELELRVSSDPANLASVRKTIEQFAARHGFDEKAVAEIGLVVNEAMANVICHAYGGRTDRPVQVRAEADGRQLVISLRDWGSGADPMQRPPAPRNPLKPGGIGMVCLRQWMDDVTFTPQPDGMLVTLVRRKT